MSPPASATLSQPHVMRSEAKKKDGGTKKGQAVKGAPAVQCPVHHLTDNECVCVRTFEARGTKLEKEKSTAPSSLDIKQVGDIVQTVCVSALDTARRYEKGGQDWQRVQSQGATGSDWGSPPAVSQQQSLSPLSPTNGERGERGQTA